MADLMKYYPAWVCARCGTDFGRKKCGIATWHHGTCGVCLKDASVTEPRDFGHLRDDWRVRYECTKTANEYGTKSNTTLLGQFEVGQRVRVLVMKEVE